jgi:hypothetical protein
MKTYIQGQGQSLTNGSIFRYALCHPFDTCTQQYAKDRLASRSTLL